MCGTVSAHRFRHTVGTQLAERGAKLHTIMKVLGHSSVNMALVYAQISDQEVLRDYKTVLAPGRGHRRPRRHGHQGVRRGALSSSDGQRFPTRGRSLAARATNTFFAVDADAELASSTNTACARCGRSASSSCDTRLGYADTGPARAWRRAAGVTWSRVPACWPISATAMRAGSPVRVHETAAASSTPM